MEQVMAGRRKRQFTFRASIADEPMPAAERQAAERLTRLESECADCVRKGRNRRPTEPVIEIALPAGMDVESAQARCTAALAELVTAQAANP